MTATETAAPASEQGGSSRAGLPIYRLDYEGAHLWMRADSEVERHWRVEACAKEPWTVAWIERMAPGDVLYDVGASTGPYSLIAARRGVQTVAFEPHFASYARLMENTALNRLSRTLTALPLALSSRTGLGVMNHTTLFPGGSGHTFWRMDGQPEDGMRDRPVFQQWVLSFRMDDLPDYDERLVPPNHIKLDVDGAEEAVLEGARRSIAGPHFRSLMLEMHEDERSAGIRSKVAELGLEMEQRYDAGNCTWGLPGGKSRGGTIYGLYRRAS